MNEKQRTILEAMLSSLEEAGEHSGLAASIGLDEDTTTDEEVRDVIALVRASLL